MLSWFGNVLRLLLIRYHDICQLIMCIIVLFVLFVVIIHYCICFVSFFVSVLVVTYYDVLFNLLCFASLRFASLCFPPSLLGAPPPSPNCPGSETSPAPWRPRARCSRGRAPFGLLLLMCYYIFFRFYHSILFIHLFCAIVIIPLYTISCVFCLFHFLRFSWIVYTSFFVNSCYLFSRGRDPDAGYGRFPNQLYIYIYIYIFVHTCFH